MNLHTQLQKKHIIVLGDIMLDRYWHGSTSRISPEAPVPVVKIEKESLHPGGAANVALNLSALGTKVTLIGITGCDSDSDALLEQLTAHNINCQFIRDESTKTIVKLRVISQQQQLIRADFEEPTVSCKLQAQLQQTFDNIVQTADAVVLSDYAKGCLRPCQAYIKSAKLHKLPIITDPKSSDWSLYDGSTIITPNTPEFTNIAGSFETSEQLELLAHSVLKQHHLDAILVTRGAKGMSLVTTDGCTHIPTKAYEVFDVTGAGDTVVATLAFALANKIELKTAVSLSNFAAGIVVGKLGTACVTQKELIASYLNHNLNKNDLLTPEALHTIIHHKQLSGKTIVMTNGCFDLLHSGHIEYLEAARQLGDYLVVAINDDASVKRLKGDSRPINTITDRITALNALACVDWVISFSEDTPQQLIEHLSPNILVKGGDYKIENIVGAKWVLEHGGQVKIMPFKKGYSTSALLEKIIKK